MISSLMCSGERNFQHFSLPPMVWPVKSDFICSNSEARRERASAVAVATIAERKILLDIILHANIAFKPWSESRVLSTAAWVCQFETRDFRLKTSDSDFITFPGT